MANRPDRPPPPPVVARVWLRYAKRGRLRFTSHRDFARAFERALRRSGVPMAYSAGFSPHPKVSYVGAAPTGVASEAEYVEIGLAAVVDVGALREALDAALPLGLDIVEAVDATEAGSGSIAARVDASSWRIRLPGVEPERVGAAFAAFTAAASVPVERMTKNGRRTLDARAALVHGRVGPDADGTCGILELVLRHVTPAVRPDDVLVALRQVANLVPPAPPEVLRCAQGSLDDAGRIADPLAPDHGQTANVDDRCFRIRHGYGDDDGAPDGAPEN